MSLKNLQEQLFKAITLNEDSTEALKWIKDEGSMNAADRLDVYQYAYRERLKECIQEDYEESLKAMGEEKFAALLEDFMNTQLSEHWNINGFNVLWNQYIQKSDCSTSVKELTEIEWLKVESFFKHNRKEAPLYKAITLSEEHNAKVRLDDSVIINNKQNTIIWTRKFETQTIKLNKIELSFLESFQVRSSLDEIISDMSQSSINDEDLANLFQKSIAQFMEKGILIQV